MKKKNWDWTAESNGRAQLRNDAGAKSGTAPEFRAMKFSLPFEVTEKNHWFQRSHWKN
jgi:hypothetical protein